ncbi:MAG: bacillithiol biosynthesis cysteine-adding enzyme BshC [Calditrichaeota bacterium]|nr:bacillithiol biosynthesis cysteine-adding enzyme BshC [Calditrichota bacterium]
MKTPMSQLPGVSALVSDYFDNFEKVAEFYNGDYRTPENFLHRSADIKTRDLPLGKLVPILKEQNQKYGCGLATLEKIDWLLERRACAVVTGQQTGLFGGPLLTIYKALTAIKLAARLSRTCEGCYVPIFWLASDDHDFREVNHIYFQDKSNAPAKLTYKANPAASRIPVSQIKLTEEIQALLTELDAATHPSEFKERVLAELADAYSAGTSFSDAFGKWLMALLKPFGLVIIDASDARIKTLGAALFEKEILEASPSTQQAIAASKKLVQRNYHNQVQLTNGFLNLFYAEEERNSIQMENGKFIIKNSGKSLQREELQKKLHEHPEHFSPNVLLRPLFQDALLPTIAYVAGPAEAAYYAQMKGIYAAFDIPMPIIYPRKSLTLREPRIEKVLDNYGLKVEDFWGNVETLITRIARAQLPGQLEKKIEHTRLNLETNLKRLEDVIAEFDPTLVDFVKSTRGRFENQLQGLEKKILQAFKKRNDVIRQQLYKAHNSLYPNNHLQERELNIVPYLFKHGFNFIDQLYEAMDVSSFEHQIVRI